MKSEMVNGERRVLHVDGITSGIVIDHIRAGNSMKLYDYLNLEELDCSVAIIRNVKSQTLGRKDIIKIDNVLDIDFDVLGYLDPNITINIIESNGIKEKKNLKLPKRLKSVIKCKNPRCITSIEQEIVHEFTLTDAENQTYSCLYCEQEATSSNKAQVKRH